MDKLIKFYDWKVIKYIESKNRLKCLNFQRVLKIENILGHGSWDSGDALRHTLQNYRRYI